MPRLYCEFNGFFGEFCAACQCQGRTSGASGGGETAIMGVSITRRATRITTVRLANGRCVTDEPTKRDIELHYLRRTFRSLSGEIASGAVSFS